jgi:putative membrane protein
MAGCVVMTMTVGAFMHPRRAVVEATGFIADPEPFSAAAPTGSGALREADQKLLVESLRAGRIETSLASIAYTRGTTDLVRQLAGHVRFDYAMANRDLMALLAAHHTALPAEDSAATIAAVDKLGTLTGPAFDHAYIAHLVRVHEAAIAQFRKSTSDRADDIGAYGERTLPVLQDHLDRAREIQLIKGW